MKHTLAALTFALSVPWASDLPAQERSTIDYNYLGSAGTVVVGLVDSAFRGGAAAVIIRRPRSPMHVVLVTRQATAKDLASALAGVIQIRRLDGDTVAQEMRAYLSEATLRGSAPSREGLESATSELERLHRALPMTVPGLGEMPVVFVSIGAVKRVS